MKTAAGRINLTIDSGGSIITSLMGDVCSYAAGAFFNTSSSLGKGAGRAWGLVCILVLFSFFVAGHALAVPAGTVISNTAQADYQSWGTPVTGNSNTVALITGQMDTPSQIELLQYAPTAAGATPMTVSNSAYSDTGTTASSVTISSIFPAGGSAPIDLSLPVPLINASLYHQGEPVFFRITDMDQNLYPAAVENVWMVVTVPGTTEAELLLLTETGPNTGVFLGYIQSGNLGAGSADDFNGLLDVHEGGQIAAHYTDADNAADTVTTAAPVDPYGLVFDSTTGLAVDNVQLTLVVDATGTPATVYGDDGVSSFPSTITSGGTFVDGAGKVYDFTPGNYRFPFVAPGTYRLIISAPPGYAAPSSVPTSVLQSLPGAPFVITDPGSRGGTFVLNPGPAIRMDVPVDPTSTGLWVQKTVSREIASVGDFVQYSVTVENHSEALASSARIVDQLPSGFRYRRGSARLDGTAAADPQIAADGRTLTFDIGNMTADASAEIRYVTEIAAGAKPGRADNQASAAAAGGLGSNVSVATVTVKEDLLRSKNFIVGRVIADNCTDAPTDDADGVAGVRIYLEDGTYVITDEQGRYHFEGVSSGTHVVQLDLETLPPIYDAESCDEDSRWSGTPFSRFVEVHGGTLWRVDFHTRTKTPPSGEARLSLSCALDGTTVSYQGDIDVQSVALDIRRLSVMLPRGSEYVSGSSRLNLKALADPQIVGDALIYRLGEAAAGSNDALQFKVRLNQDAQPGQLHTRALMTFDTPGQKNQRTGVIDTVLALDRRMVKHTKPPVIVHPQFNELDAELTENDRIMLDRLVARLKGLEIEHVVFTGHTDDRPIRAGLRNAFADNHALSRERASSVASYLATRLDLDERQMIILGKGADQPIADNATESGRAQNRRVEVKVMSARVEFVHDVASIKCEDQVAAVTRGQYAFETSDIPGAPQAAPAPEESRDQIDLETLQPGYAFLAPAPGYRPHIPSLKLAVQHAPFETIELWLNGRKVSRLNFEGQRLNRRKTVAVSYWRGVDLDEGDNHLTAICKNSSGKETRRIERVVHYAGAPVHVELIEAKSRLVANGKDIPAVALRFTDKDGQPARFGSFGEYNVLSPFQAFDGQKGIEGDPITRIGGETPRYNIGADGIAYIKLEPTTQSGYATIKVPLSNKEHEVRVWLQSELRDWILVGLAEGTAGYITLSGNMEGLNAADQEEDLYQDGRLAFFAKGRIKGKWLLTAAYDSGREREDNDTGLFQTIDPDTYYTLYGDAAQQQNEAPSIRKLYLKIERERFYALFGDYDTGLAVTELSRYSRRFNGLKSEYVGDVAGFTAFASDTDQAFVKNEIRGNGTSGLYRLSRNHIVPNSETVTIETRNRFRSEIIVTSQVLSRHIDYNIDYDAATLFFKTPVYSRDENFNPTYIVVDYETRGDSREAYTYGGRGSVRMADGKVELGATVIHEGPSGARADLGGLDARIDLGKGVQAKAEAAATRKDNADGAQDGHAYLAEVSKQTENLDSRVYFREQGEGFGLGQQNGSEDATRKIGADMAWRVDDHWRLSGEIYRQYNLATEAERDLGEARAEYHRSLYNLFTGLRMVEDRLGNSDTNRSNQWLVGASRRFLNNRLQGRISHEQSLFGENDSVDFPTRTIIGADYRLADPVTLYAEHEIAQGTNQSSRSSRLGVKAEPWSGGRMGSSLGREYSENGRRTFANLGLTQTWQISDRWSVDGGLDRTQTLDQEADHPPFNDNVPTAAGAEEDFTAVSLGAAYRADIWSWTGRAESRLADSEDKWSLITGIAGEVRKGLGLSAGFDVFSTQTRGGVETLEGKGRLSMAWRPKNTRWIVLDRLDYKFDDRKDSDAESQARRIVNNLNANYKPYRKLQVALQYGAKYVFDTFDQRSYAGYTDLTGMEARYDLSKSWDVGLHAGLLHSWDAGQLDYRTGCSLGYSMMKNMWISLGYNFTGFKDEDFSEADYTAAGPFIKMRLKFDQRSVREMVSWFASRK